MGFYVMIFSMISGIFLIALGVSRKKNKKSKLLNVVMIFTGIILSIFAIWLAFPK